MNNREIHRRLILGSIDEELKSLIELLEMADPGLQGLSPLARAAWRLHSRGSVNREEAEAALAATFLIPSDDAEGLLEGGGNLHIQEREIVAHSIPIQVTSPTNQWHLELSFHSYGDSIHMLEGAYACIDLVSLIRKAGLRIASDEQLLFSAYEAAELHTQPQCEPCDSEFIGNITYTLREIAGEPVSGPCLSDLKHDIAWQELGLLEEEPEEPTFCWLHQLTREQAESLGLARERGKHQDPSMPEWLRDDVAFSLLWITPDDLYANYSNGNVTGCEIDYLLLCLGAGPEWIPGDWDGQLDEIDGDLEDQGTYPETQQPLHVFAFTKGSACDDPDAAAALQLLDRLIQVCVDPPN